MMGTQARRNEDNLRKIALDKGSQRKGNRYNPDVPSKFVKVTPAPIWFGKKKQKAVDAALEKLALAA